MLKFVLFLCVWQLCAAMNAAESDLEKAVALQPQVVGKYAEAKREAYQTKFLLDLAEEAYQQAVSEQEKIEQQGATPEKEKKLIVVQAKVAISAKDRQYWQRAYDRAVSEQEKIEQQGATPEKEKKLTVVQAKVAISAKGLQETSVERATW